MDEWRRGSEAWKQDANCDATDERLGDLRNRRRSEAKLNEADDISANGRSTSYQPKIWSSFWAARMGYSSERAWVRDSQA
jgi:hypothetical protein